MALQSDGAAVPPVEPEAGLINLRPGDWGALPCTDPVIEHIIQRHWEQPEQPVAWEAARFSKAAYLYRETRSGWSVVAKFYAPKTGSSAERHAARELECIQEAQAIGLAAGRLRAVRPLGAWRGVLFLEHVEGLTLADVIAVRRSQPGTLLPGLTDMAKLLAELHIRGARPEIAPSFEPTVANALKYVSQLERHGVLKDEPILADGLRHNIERWTVHPAMARFTPSLTHGDATTTNFIFAREGGVVAIDWERMEVADPAADLGRLAAEISHSARQQGGKDTEIESLVRHLIEAYRQAIPDGVDVAGLIGRVPFYQGSSTLRIARNGWLGRLDRMALVTQAMALLD